MRNLLAALAFLALSVGCSSEDPTDPTVPIGLSLSLSPSSDTLFLAVGQVAPSTTQLTATAKVRGRAVTLPGHVFESADESVATVDASGLVTARAVGTTTVTVRVNDVRASTTIVVLPIVKSVTLTTPATTALVGDTTVLTAATLDWAGLPVAGQPITFTSSSPSAIVSPTGRVVFVAPGSATITAQSAGASATVTLTALARQFIGGGSSSLSSGLDVTCGLLPLGKTFCFGKAPVIGVAKDTLCFGRVGEFDEGPAGCTLVPLQIAGGLSLTALAAGDDVACGLTGAGKTYCWGIQTFGQIGNGVSSSGTSVLPTLVTGPLIQAATFTQITAGGSHACGIASGQAYCWGKDETLQLGGGDNLFVNSSTPIPVQQGVTFKSLAAGRSHTCGLTAAGAAYCWGLNTSGQLGRGTSGDTTDTPAPVSGGLVFAQLSARGDNTCGLTTTGTIYCWGANHTGQTGSAPSLLAVTTPSPVAGTGYTFVAVGGSDSTKADGPMAHVCALSGTSVSCWGSNRYGQLGRAMAAGTGALSPIPAPVAGSYTALSSGTRTSCAVASDGAYCWGSSIYGATGTQIQALGVTMPTLTAPPQ